jgi:NAD(P)H-hydrate epimerase
MAIRLFRSLPLPMVVDADALNALATRRRPLADAAGPRIVTPHPGEFTRLSGTAPPRKQQEQRAQEIARSTGCIVVLKGHATLVTDGQRSFRNTTGNPGMATGGTGDVLTGVLAALVAQGLSAWDAARLGVFLHGLAGDLAAGRLGEISVTATDLIDALPEAFGCLARKGIARSAKGAPQP